MPYVVRNASNLIYIVMENPIDENTEWVDPSNDDLNWFNTKKSKLGGLSFEYSNRTISIVHNNVLYPVSGDGYQSITCRITIASMNQDPNVDIPETDFDLHTLLIADATSLLSNMDGYINNVEVNKLSIFGAIQDSTTLAEIQAVDVAAGWPSQSL